MTARSRLAALGLALLAAGCAVPGLPKPPTDAMPGLLVVRFAPGAAPEARSALLARAGASTDLAEGDLARVQVPTGTEGRALALLRAESATCLAADFEVPRRDQMVPGSFRPAPRALMQAATDPYLAQAWHFKAIGADAAWSVTRGERRVKVAVLDTGVDLVHPDLQANLDMTNARNLIENNRTPDDDFGHGTHVAGLVAAVAGNGIGACGVAPGVLVTPYRVLGADGTGTSTTTILALDAAVAAGCKIVNLSLGSPSRSDVEADAIARAQAKGVLIVAAAGNEAADGNYVEYPAAYPGVLAVGATDRTDARALFSNFGSYVSITAPGVDILSTLPTRFAGAGSLYGPYGYLSGTSMASPIVAGAAALVASAQPNLTGAQIADRLLSSAKAKGLSATDAPGFNPFFGHGILQAGAALQAP